MKRPSLTVSSFLCSCVVYLHWGSKWRFIPHWLGGRDGERVPGSHGPQTSLSRQEHMSRESQSQTTTNVFKRVLKQQLHKKIWHRNVLFCVIKGNVTSPQIEPMIANQVFAPLYNAYKRAVNKGVNVILPGDHQNALIYWLMCWLSVCDRATGLCAAQWRRGHGSNVRSPNYQ